MARVFTKNLNMSSGSKWGELILDITPGTQNIANNTTAITYELYVQRTATNFGGYWSNNSNTASLTINGTAISVPNFTYDFRTNYKKSLQTGSMVIEHTNDGSKTISASASVSMTGNVPSGSDSGSLTLTTIPRASSFTLGGSTETGSAVTVTINRASTSFTHRVRWRIGSGAWTTSATAATTSSSVTVPHTAIPSSNSAAVTIAVQTFSGTTAIGSEVSATRTLTVPASVIPSFSAITATENVSEVKTKVGAFVKGKSKLNLAITGAQGSGGSTIKGYEITLTGTTINAASGVSNLVTTSGNVVITGTVTDSRGRTGSKTLTINVLDYAAPTLTGLAFYRSNSAGVADPTGTYVTVKGTVTVSSLIVGTTQKNKVSYDAQHDKSGSFVSFITETPNVITKAFTNILPTFTIDKIFNFRSRAGDIFGYGGWSVGVVPSGEVTQQWSRKTTSFGKMIDNTGYNVQVGTGGIQSDGPGDFLGQLTQNDGIQVPNGWVGVLPRGDLNLGSYWRALKPGQYKSGNASGLVNNKGAWSQIMVWKDNGSDGVAHTRALWMDQGGLLYYGAVSETQTAMTWNRLLNTSTDDFIVEGGSSGMWAYRKWNSGRCEMWGTLKRTLTVGSAWGNMYASGNESIPRQTLPFTVHNVRQYVSCSSASYSGMIMTNSAPTRTQTSPCEIVRATQAPSMSWEIDYHIQGNWK